MSKIALFFDVDSTNVKTAKGFSHRQSSVRFFENFEILTRGCSSMIPDAYGEHQKNGPVRFCHFVKIFRLRHLYENPCKFYRFSPLIFCCRFCSGNLVVTCYDQVRLTSAWPSIALFKSCFQMTIQGKNCCVVQPVRYFQTWNLWAQLFILWPVISTCWYFMFANISLVV